MKSVEEITEIVKLCFENIKTNLSLSYLLSYLVFAMEFDTANLRLEQIPGESIYTNGVWVFKANDSETKNLFERLKWK